MSPELAARISGEVAKVAKDPEVVGKMSALGFTLMGTGPEEFRKVVHGDLDRWARLGAEIGVRRP